MAFSVTDYKGDARSIEGVDPIAARIALINDKLNAEISVVVVVGPGMADETLLPNPASAIVAALAFTTASGAAAAECMLNLDDTDVHLSADGSTLIWDIAHAADTIVVAYRSKATVELDQLLRPYPQS